METQTHAPAKEHYDVIIVGAGIGGLHLTTLLKDTNLRVLLLERRPTIKKLQNHIYGTSQAFVEKWHMEKYIVIPNCGFGFYTVDRHVFRHIPKPFCVVDVDPWAETLNVTCDVKTHARVKGLKREEGGISLTVADGSVVHGKIIIDCSGDSQIIGSLLGLRKSRCDFLDLSVVFENVAFDRIDEMSYFQDARLVNCGGWYHPVSKTSALLGISEWTGEKHLDTHEMKKRYESFLRDFEPFNRYFKNATVKEVIAKIGPTTDMHTSIVEDNYLAVGDAAGAGTPFIGLGFYTALEMAGTAFEAIQKAFQKNDFSKRSLRSHAREFHRQFGRWYKWSCLLRWVFMKYVTNKELSIMADRLPAYSDEDYSNILLSYIGPRIILKLVLPQFAWLKILKNAFIFHVLQPFGIARVPKRPLHTPDGPFRFNWEAGLESAIERMNAGE